MLTFDEYREEFINSIEIKSETDEENPVVVFLQEVEDILSNDYRLLSQIDSVYFDIPFSKSQKGIHIDGGYFEEAANTLHLVSLIYDTGEIKSISKDVLDKKVSYLRNFFIAALDRYFASGEKSSPVFQFAKEIIENVKAGNIYKIDYIVATNNKFTNGCKSLETDPLFIKDHKFECEITTLDMTDIYNSKQMEFIKTPLIINTNEFEVNGIPCIKADLQQDKYDAYLAILPGKFLSDIYKKFNSRLLEGNVRSFLNFKGGVNKGIRATILNEKDNFFAYNNGISATATDVKVDFIEGKGYFITKFTDLQIINGGQTTASLAKSSINDKADLSGVFVQMKLTISKDNNPEFVSSVAKYANSQNKVTGADLNSNHDYYIRMQEYSRKIFVPARPGQTRTKWYFERSRGQYEQESMQMTPSEMKRFKAEYPSNQKIKKTDIAKFANSANQKPYDVSWGAEVNADRFFTIMEKNWKSNKDAFNEIYYKELIGKGILFNYIMKLISKQDWYIEKSGYRPQLTTYTFSKLVYEVEKQKLKINYLNFWEIQDVPSDFNTDIISIGKLCFDVFYQDSIANISTYCKKQECWNVIKEKKYNLSSEIEDFLLTKEDEKILKISAIKEQKNNNEVSDQIKIFNIGVNKWRLLLDKGIEQKILNIKDEELIRVAINYCQTGVGCSPKQSKAIIQIKEKLEENGIR